MTDELGELRAEMRRLSAKVASLDAGAGHTIMTSRGSDMWRRRMILVGVASSAATAALILGVIGVHSLLHAEPAAAPPPPPLPQVIVQAPPSPPPATPPVPVAAPEPEPVASAVPPKRRIANRDLYDPTGDTSGSLTVVCLPTKCDSIVDNGAPLGPGHIFSRPTSAGRHTLNLHSVSGEKTITVDVLPGRLKDVRVWVGPAADIPALRDNVNPYM